MTAAMPVWGTLLPQAFDLTVEERSNVDLAFWQERVCISQGCWCLDPFRAESRGRSGKQMFGHSCVFPLFVLALSLILSFVLLFVVSLPLSLSLLLSMV